MPVDEKWALRRLDELNVFAQMEAERAQRLAVQQRQEAEFMSRVAARRDALEQGKPFTVPPIKTLDAIYGEAREALVAEKARLEQERRAAITPRDKLISVLSTHKKAALARYKSVNGEDCPMELIPYL